ncbi:Ntn hydrolase family protein [Robiginitalea sediminis]|uniref:hypothetical protein n=1 Tax=Robiginitalea sediminis TaxID=1982593 RepID=UPI000B4B529E|nr:hypothetical protein [Robiginitalea sediminis]
MRYIILLVILVFSLGNTVKSYSQTCIVAVKTPRRIVVGADSRVLIDIEDPVTHKLTTVKDSTCKIIQVSNYNLAFAGNYSDSAKDISRSILAEGNYSFDSAISVISESFVQQVERKLLRVKRNHEKLYNDIGRRNIKNDGSFASIIIFGVESDSLYLGVSRFNLDLSNSIKLTFKTYTGTIITAGHVEEINMLLEQQSTWQNGVESGIANLIEIASNEHPNEVGGPIDILSVSRDSTIWIKRKDACQ